MFLPYFYNNFRKLVYISIAWFSSMNSISHPNLNISKRISIMPRPYVSVYSNKQVFSAAWSIKRNMFFCAKYSKINNGITLFSRMIFVGSIDEMINMCVCFEHDVPIFWVHNDEMINTFTIELAHTSYLSKKTTLNMWFKIDCLLEKRSF